MPHPKKIYCLACKHIVDNHLVGDIYQHMDAVCDCPCNATNVVPRVYKSKVYFVEVVDLVLTEDTVARLKACPPNITEEERNGN